MPIPNLDDQLSGQDQRDTAEAKAKGEDAVKSLLRKVAEYMPTAELTIDGKEFKP